MSSMQQTQSAQPVQQVQPSLQEKLTWKGWVSLFALMILLSGIFTKSEGFLRAFDFTNLSGSFGTIYENVTFQGKGGSGAREGVMVAISLIPMTAFATALIDVCQSLGAMKAAEILFRPLLKPLYGIPGICGIAFVASFTSSDLGAIMTKQLFQDGLITDDERTVFVSYQYAGTAVIGNTISTQAPLLPISLLALGPVIGVLFICKTIGANIVRLILMLNNKKKRGA